MAAIGRQLGELVRRRFGDDTERGVSAVEFAMLMPIFLPLVFLLIQAGLYYHALNVTQAVAQTTARVIRTPGNPSPTTALPGVRELNLNAQDVAVQTWESLDANHTSSRPAAAVTLDAGIGDDASNQITVTVQSECVNLLPGIFPDLPLEAQASGPIEIFKPQGTN